MPAVPSRPQEQGIAYQAQMRSNLYHKLGGLERGGAACHSSVSYMYQGEPRQMPAAAHAGEASGTRRVIASSATRVKLKRKEMRTEAQTQGEGSGSLESAGDGGVEGERPRKRHRVSRHTGGEEGRDYVCDRSGSDCKKWYSLVWHTRAHREHATTVKRKMKDGTVAATPLLQRSLQCSYCQAKRAFKQYRPMHLRAKHGQPRREARHNSLKVECKESAVHLLECPSLRELRKRSKLETMKDGKCPSALNWPAS
ncbi:hypothetical protein TRVL_06956 [Trypanosoma vivax]|nr:hypothetical protein TRVL_06956 [Trypanosoma vivax]